MPPLILEIASLLIASIALVGIALGEIKPLRTNRAGIALAAAVALVAIGALKLDEAFTAIDLDTIALLLSMMILSAFLRFSGIFDLVASRLLGLSRGPKSLLAALILVSGIGSAIFLNDTMCLVLSPLVILICSRAQLNPLPYLIGVATSSNIGSMASIIGNPQNMLIGQVYQLHFSRFLYWCAPPSLLALAAAYLLIFALYRRRFVNNRPTALLTGKNQWPDFNRWQSFKGLTAILLLIFLFFTPIPRELSAIGLAGILLCSRKMKSRHMLELIDWHLITLFCALFVVNQGLAMENIPAMFMETIGRQGVALDSLPVLAGLSALLSNLVSNVPAVMLLIHFLDPGNPIQCYVLAVSSTFAGNLIVIGSIANLIVIEQARNCGIEISFKRHAAVGIPVTILSLTILIGWIYM